MTYAHRLRNFLDGLAMLFSLFLVHLRCARTAGQQRHEESDDDPLRAARGVMNGIAISLALWAIIGALVVAAAQWWW